MRFLNTRVQTRQNCYALNRFPNFCLLAPFNNIATNFVTTTHRVSSRNCAFMTSCMSNIAVPSSRKWWRHALTLTPSLHTGGRSAMLVFCLKAALRSEEKLLSLIAVNCETGTCNSGSSRSCVWVRVRGGAFCYQGRSQLSYKRRKDVNLLDRSSRKKNFIFSMHLST
jgi:hypothetical protein